MSLKVKLLREGAKFKSATDLDSGYDVVALGYKRVKNKKLEEERIITDTLTIRPNETVLLLTGVAIELPTPSFKKDYVEVIEAQARPRSGASLKENKVAILGTIDNKYRGEIGIIMTNNSNTDIVIEKGERVAQIVLNVIRKYEVEFVNELEETERGANGFGSTGK